MVAGHLGRHGLHVNKKQVKNVNVVHDHVHNQNLSLMENFAKEIQLKSIDAKVELKQERLL